MILPSMIAGRGYIWRLAILVIAAASHCDNRSRAVELFDESQAVTLFAFDEVSIPFSQNLRLEMRSPTRHPANPILRRGEAGTPDAMGVQFYGSVLREGNLFRMWYVAQDDDLDNKVATSRWRPAYAESDDGIVWRKPSLGLVEYRGNKNNNLILTHPGPLGFVNLKVLLDPDDEAPDRRYKMATHVYFRHQSRLGTLAPYASPDGLRWHLLSDAMPHKAELHKEDLVLPAIHFEPCGGLYRWEGMFYACGQNAMPATLPYQGRVTRMYRSADFVHWSHTSSIGLIRAAQRNPLGPGRSLEGEQTHEGISVWNRRNVLLGVFGQWHGAKDWKDITVDLGFALSNDGIQFREPVPEWTFLKRADDVAWDQGGLLQGQGFENVGDQTFIYYGAWDPRQRGSARGGVGIAILPRDRFGELVVDESAKGTGDYQTPTIVSEFITSAVNNRAASQPQLFVNVDGLGKNARLRIELLDPQERPIVGYSGVQAAIIETNGFQVPVEWPAGKLPSPPPERFKIRGVFEGERNVTIRLSAIYVL